MDYLIAKIINFILNSKIKLFLILNMLNVLLFFILKDIIYFGIIEIIILVIVFSTKRVSDVLVYNKLANIISMNLKNVKMFSSYNYEMQKQEIIEIFKESLILGILNTNANILKCDTHKWVLNNVFKDKRILEKYDINYKECGVGNFKYNVLLLSNGKYINIHPRQKIRIKLKKK